MFTVSLFHMITIKAKQTKHCVVFQLLQKLFFANIYTLPKYMLLLALSLVETA